MENCYIIDAESEYNRIEIMFCVQGRIEPRIDSGLAKLVLLYCDQLSDTFSEVLLGQWKYNSITCIFGLNSIKHLLEYRHGTQ